MPNFFMAALSVFVGMLLGSDSDSSSSFISGSNSSHRNNNDTPENRIPGVNGYYRQCGTTYNKKNKT